MSGTKDDSRCQKAVRIVTELCRKKSLPSLDLDMCREFLLLPPDQSLIISEPGTVPWSCLREQCWWPPRKAGGPAQGQGSTRKPGLGSGGLVLARIAVWWFSFTMVHYEVLGASAASPVDAEWCGLMGTAAQRGQTGCDLLVRRWLMRYSFFESSLFFKNM